MASISTYRDALAELRLCLDKPEESFQVNGQAMCGNQDLHEDR